MQRRRFLGTVGTGFLVGTAGCVGGDTPASSEAETPDTNPTSPPVETVSNASSGALRDPDLPLEYTDLVRAASEDAIPAIDDPAFGEDWSGVTETLGDRDRVIGLAIDGRARAYPLPILNWHEVVNDSFDGPLLVTYCPLCQSGVTAERRVDGQETEFGVSGYLWQRDLVLYDHLTGSLWSQILAKAVRGPRTGASLTLRPSTMTTWGEWRTEYPDTSVLLPPPESGTVSETGRRNYNTNPYTDYENHRQPQYDIDDGEGVDPKAFVIGVTDGNGAKAYPFRAVIEADGVVNDCVGDLPVVVATTRDSLVAYVRRVDGTVLEFDRDDDALVAGGSQWNVVGGTARSGPYEGVTLARANDRSPMFWFAWRKFFPGTAVYS